MNQSTSSTICNLRKFRDLSSDFSSHCGLIKDKKIILYAATLLDTDNAIILDLCLEILENFVANEQAHSFLLSTFGIYEALEALTLRIRGRYKKLYERAFEITEILRDSSPPAYNTRGRTKETKRNKKHHLYLLFFSSLNEDTLPKLEQALLKIRGVISFLVDLENKRCTIRICPKITIREVVEKIFTKCNMKAMIITKNSKNGTEDLCDILESTRNKSYLEFPDEEICPKEKTVADFTLNVVKSGNGLLKSVVSFWNDSFYW